MSDGKYASHKFISAHRVIESFLPRTKDETFQTHFLFAGGKEKVIRFLFKWAKLLVDKHSKFPSFRLGKSNINQLL